MKAITRGLSACVVLTGAALGLAAPASADPLSGNYTYTVIDSDKFPTGAHMPMVYTPCGPDCTRVLTDPNNIYDFHLQGSTWVSDGGGGGQDSFDANSLAGHYVSDYGGGWYVNYKLSRDG